MESIKSTLLAKIQTVQKTLPDVALEDFLENIRGWKFDWYQNPHSNNNQSYYGRNGGNGKQTSAVSH